MQPAWIKLDLKALQHNYEHIHKLSNNTRIMAIIKNDAYGHGAVRIAKALPQADAFGVSLLDEALELRAAGIAQPIVLMTETFDAAELEQIAEHGFQIFIYHDAQLESIEKTPLNIPITVWLKLDTGMHRLGFNPEAALQAYQRLQACTWVKQPINWLTHLADADDVNKITTTAQIARFQEFTQNLPGFKSISNSAGILAWSDANTQNNWVRPGLILYGVSPLPDKTGEQLGFQPVMTLYSRIIAINQLKRGDAIGYGGISTCPEDMPVGVVSFGYGRGYPRHAQPGTPILIHNTLCPLIGRVSMQLITVDLRQCPQAKVGDEVILWGRGLPVETIAQYANTIPYELLCKTSTWLRVVE